MCWSVVSGSLLPLLMLVVVFPSFVPIDRPGLTNYGYHDGESGVVFLRRLKGRL
ncbi:hypothetical protein K456DRAFT_46658 [Colletotrichum gloeosporioides 23]|nr:hypothetical protein K456DRAFT_46658 [Colletotrichum gloeosporioides 23]